MKKTKPKSKAAPKSKVTAKRKPAVTARKRTTRVKRSAMQTLYLVPVTFRRIVLLTACVLLVVVAATSLTSKNGNLTQAVAGVSVARGLFEQATVSLSHVDGAIAYNLYYKQASDSEFTNAVRNIPPDVSEYTVSYLKKGTTYEYKISALGTQGEEFSWTEVKQLTDLQPM